MTPIFVRTVSMAEVNMMTYNYFKTYFTGGKLLQIRKLKDVPPRKKVPVASSSGNAHGNPNEDATDNGVIENDADLKSAVGISGGETIANGQVRRKVCLCPDEMAGHTGYITFASFPPAWIRQQQTLSSSTVNIETVDEEPKIIS